MADLKTYGDLKKAINIISLKQKGEKISNIAIDTVIGAIPGLGTAKTTFDFIRAAVSKPDTKKTNTWLDKLDIDDNMSKIIDDTVENGFMKVVSKTIEGEADDKPLEQDFNMNQKLVDYLKGNYQGRTVTGIRENKMKKSHLRQVIKEEIQNILNEQSNQSSIKQTSASKAYQQTAQKATPLQTKASQIKTINDLPGVFQTWFDSLGLKDKPGVSQSLILSKIKDTLIKMGVK